MNSVRTALKVCVAGPNEYDAWDAFVDAHPHGTPFHLTAWRRALEANFDYRPHYLMAVGAGRIFGVLPLFLVENFILGKALISSPFAVYGGILAADEEARDFLAAKAAELGQELGVEQIELRNARAEQCAGFPRRSGYFGFTQPVQPVGGEVLIQSLPKKTRNMVRRALKHPYECRRATNLDAFLDLLARSYRRYGTPFFPRGWFEALLENFGPLVDIREIVLEGKVVAVSLNFTYHGEMHTYYAASDAAALAMAPNNYLYYDHLLWAGENGCHTFDFGRSKADTGPYEFKRHWPTEMRELPYETVLVRAQTAPDLTPKNPKFSFAIQAWQRLPLAFTRIIGPRLIRLFP